MFKVLTACLLLGAVLTACQSEPQPTRLRDASPGTHQIKWPRIISEVPPDAALEQRVADILASMTLEQKNSANDSAGDS